MAMRGTDVLLLVDGQVVGSQRNVVFGQESEAIVVSSKTGRGARVRPGRYDPVVTLEALYVPDDAAYLALQAAMRNGTMVELLRRESGTDLEEACGVVTGLSMAAPDQDGAVITAQIRMVMAWYMLLETGDHILTEVGDPIVMEAG